MFARHLTRRVPFVLAGGCLLTATGSTLVLCENQTSPPFELGGSRYDTTQYVGRVQQILEQIDPRTMFISDKEVKRCQDLLKEFETKGSLPDGVDDEMMWEAQKTVKAVIHGPTGQKMFLPGRMSAFVPMNVPTCAGMLIHGPTSTAASVFWQWANQTYNILNNYVNRAGPEVDTMGLLRSYVLAVGASVGIALAAGAMMKRRPHLKALGPIVPYCAVATAGTCNVSFTRMDEILNGIDVMDHEGTVLGRSTAAGKLAVFKTVTTRSMFLPIIPLLLPTVSMNALTRARLIVAGTPTGIAVNILIITLSMSLALPCALAILPETMELDVNSLEPEFQGHVDKQGQPVKVVFASKGL